MECCHHGDQWCVACHGEPRTSKHCQLRRNWRAESTTCWGQLPNQRRWHVRHCCWHYQGRRSNQFPNLVVLASHEQHLVVNSWMIYHQHFKDLFWQIKNNQDSEKIRSCRLNRISSQIISRPFQSKMASMVAVQLKNKIGTAYRLFTYVANCSGYIRCVRRLRELPLAPSRRAGWPSIDLLTDHTPPSLSPIAITRVSSLASFNILILFVQASHVIHLGAATNIWNNLPQFPISYTVTEYISYLNIVVRSRRCRPFNEDGSYHIIYQYRKSKQKRKYYNRVIDG